MRYPLIFTLILASFSQAEEITYNAHIRSILSDKCVACHGPDSKKREAELRLDTFEGATAPLSSDGQLFAIRAGNPAQSEMFKRIDSRDEDDVMPPPHFHKHITKAERELLWQWVEQGAKYEAHWAYTPIEKPTPAATAENPIDAFILAQLQEKKIKPSPRAQPAQLLRRLSLDLTGLPPTPAEVVAFEKAAAQDFETAFDSEITRLLESPRFGERMAVPWLDIVRFSDTVGYHGDQNVRIFPYRDYVIKAFNENKPFNEFITEQLAGDLLKNPTAEQLVATGFNRLGMMSREGGIQPKEYIAKYAADRVRAVGQAFLGQTTGCAECHDHKFDPISAKDFYSLAAFFDDVLEWGVYQNYLPLYKGLENHNNDSPFPPELVVKSDSLLAQIQLLHEQVIDDLVKQPVDAAAFDAWKSEVLPSIKSSSEGWSPAKVAGVGSGKNTPFQILADDSVEFTGAAKKDDVLHLKLTPANPYLGSIEIQALPGEATGKVGRNAGGGFLVRGPANSAEARKKDKKLPAIQPGYEVYLKKADGSGQSLEIAWVQADLFAHDPRGFRNGSLRSYSLDGVWESAPGRFEYPKSLAGQPQTAIVQLKSAIKIEPGDLLTVRIHSADISRIKIRTSPFLDPVPGQGAIPATLLAGVEKNDPNALKAAFQLSQGALPGHLDGLRTRIRRLEAGWARSLVTATRPLEERLSKTRILNRGDWQDESGPEVTPAVFHFLPSDSVAKDRRLTRLDLARWLTAEENPLTARHFVNRTWKQFFGSGLSNVLSDLGAQGEWPSHPGLLDWLAADFRENDWDVKKIIRKMVSSEAYQRKAAHRYELQDVDPGYRLYAQQAPRRLDAEFVRDNALAISGLLNTELTGGPSARPYQPEGYYKPINFPTRSYGNTNNENQYRRGVYMHWQRTFLHPMLANFDAPTRVECSADRLQANSPQQALTLLNDPSFTEAARAFAVRLMEDQSLTSDEQFITAAYRAAISREPRKEEMKSLTRFLATQRENIASGKDDPEKFLGIGLYRAPAHLDQKELAARAQLCRVVLNLHETITRY
ncbi:PSD1 and planctomycete cytochrome C domain-containing protein [Verrucomicrobiaceae bacterium 227]